MTKKLKITLVVGAIATVLVAVVLGGVVSKLTDGYNNFNPTEIFTRDLNEENLLYGSYDDLDTITHTSGITIENKNNVIILDGKVNEDDATAKYVFASVELEPGTYTYSCFEKLSMNSYYSYASFIDSENTVHTVFADFEKVSGVATEGIVETMTFTLTEKTVVDFSIIVRPGANLNNVKAMPCLVPGEDVGEFYAK